MTKVKAKKDMVNEICSLLDSVELTARAAIAAFDIETADVYTLKHLVSVKSKLRLTYNLAASFNLITARRHIDLHRLGNRLEEASLSIAARMEVDR